MVPGNRKKPTLLSEIREEWEKAALDVLGRRAGPGLARLLEAGMAAVVLKARDFSTPGRQKAPTLRSK
jgi:hypothetical protein